MRQKINKLDLAALVVSIAAIVITIWQGVRQSEFQKSSLRPYLSIEFLKSDNEPEKGFLIKNGGNGPAVIESFKIFKNDEDYLRGVYHRQWLNSGDTSEIVFMGLIFNDINNLTPGYVISNQSGSAVFLLGTKANLFYNTKTARSMESVIIEIEYRSILKEDKTIYYLKFCEKFERNNVDKRAKNLYE